MTFFAGNSKLYSVFINSTFSFAPSPAYLPYLCILGRVNKRCLHDEIQVATLGSCAGEINLCNLDYCILLWNLPERKSAKLYVLISDPTIIALRESMIYHV